MDAARQPHLRQLLNERREAIAERWQRAIEDTGFAPHSEAEVHQRLLALTDRAIALLLAAPVDREEARAIGAAVARLHYIRPAALGRTLEVLARELVANLPAAEVVALQPRLVTLLAEVAAGYYEQARATILAEQETIRGALLIERQRAAGALRRSEARFRAIFADAAIGIALVDLAGRLLESNPALQRLLGYSGDELRDLAFTQFTHPDDVAADLELYRELVAGTRDHYQLAKRYLHKDGQVVWGRLTVSLVRDGDGQPLYAIGMVEDITEYKRVAADLAAARRRLAEAREAERLRLAWALHDGAVQQLLGVRHHLAAVGRHATRGQPLEELTAALTDIEGHIVTVAQGLRGLVGTLRSAGLAEHGLPAVLTEHVAQLRREHEAAPRIALALDPAGRALPLPVARTLLRVAQEALRNTLRHAGSAQITVQLAMAPDWAEVVVADDGRGTAMPARLGALARAGHFGLAGLEEEVTLAGGSFTVASRPGAGTTVTARLPRTLQEDDDGREAANDPGAASR